MHTRNYGVLFVLPLFSLALLTGCGSSTESESVTASVNDPTAEKPAATKSVRPKKDDLHPVVQIRTSHGDITVQLDAEKAPVSVANFLDYTNSGHYDGTLFHEVEDQFIALAGGFDTKKQEKPTGFPIRNEAHNGLKNKRGSIALARSPEAIDSSTSQFFFNLADNAALDHQGDDPQSYGYCVFGEVTAGLEALDKIAKTPIKKVDQFNHMPTEQITIQSVRRLR